MKKVVGIAMSLVLVAGMATSALSAEGGNPRKGKALFKKSCKECHSQGGSGGEVTPMSKTMQQWDRLFEKFEHQPALNISPEDLKDIQQFLYDHAADSPQPATCG